jgi:hypothetical protein
MPPILAASEREVRWGLPGGYDGRERKKRWVQRGRYAVQVEVEVVYPAEDLTQPCLEPETVRLLDEIARRAERGDVEYLRKVGRVFETVT